MIRPRLWFWFASCVAVGTAAGVIVGLTLYHFAIARLVAAAIERSLQ